MSKDKPILFNAEMVRAVLDERKTQTRRVMKFQPCDVENITLPSGLSHQTLRCYNPPEKFKGCASGWSLSCPGPFTNPYGQVGDHLWVRETHALWDTDWCCGSYSEHCHCQPERIPIYRADYYPHSGEGVKWIPSIHMKRENSRIQLVITDVRVERVQSISPQDALKEGVFIPPSTPKILKYAEAVFQFGTLWNSIYRKKEGHSWEDNPWVWVVEFKVINVKGGNSNV